MEEKHVTRHHSLLYPVFTKDNSISIIILSILHRRSRVIFMEWNFIRIAKLIQMLKFPTTNNNSIKGCRRGMVAMVVMGTSYLIQHL